jgi:ABC-type lipopolysaccharide export system ATPase subunit
VGILSGGIKRFLEIILLLYSETHFILLDEPFSHLSPVLIESLYPKIIAQAQQKGIIITDHYYRHVLNLSSRLLLLRNGKTHSVHKEQELVDLGYLPA